METDEYARECLIDAGYVVRRIPMLERTVVVFENESIIGFLRSYQSPRELITLWHSDSRSIIQESQFLLRRSTEKAWNTYLVFLAHEQGNIGENFTISAIEEDLIGTRKIARAGADSKLSVKNALLPLLQIQNTPLLKRVDMDVEIRLRTSELPQNFIDAFLAGVPEDEILTLLGSLP